jgi:hypothetical protein
VDILMTQQDNLDADVAALTAALGDVSAQTGAIGTTTQQIADEIEQLKNANPALDLSALDQLAANAAQQAGALDSAVQGLAGLVPAQPGS